MINTGFELPELLKIYTSDAWRSMSQKDRREIHMAILKAIESLNKREYD